MFNPIHIAIAILFLILFVAAGIYLLICEIDEIQREIEAGEDYNSMTEWG